jgi:hypothetical protein
MEYTNENIIKVIADHYSYSTSVVYASVRNKCEHIDINSEEIKKYDIIAKQKEQISKNMAMRRQSVSAIRSSVDLTAEIFFNDDNEPGYCSKLYFDTNTGCRRCIDFIHLINLLYIAVSIPMLISFDIKMEWYLI